MSANFQEWMAEMWSGEDRPATWNDWPKGLKEDLCKAMYLSGHSVTAAEILWWRLTNHFVAKCQEFAAEATRALSRPAHCN